MRHHLTPVRMAIFQKNIPKTKMKQKHNKCWKEFGKIGILVHSRRFLKKLKIEPQYDPWIPLPGIYPKEWKAGSWEDTGTPFFTAALHITASCGTSPRPTARWPREKMWSLHTTECSAALKRSNIYVLFTVPSCGVRGRKPRFPTNKRRIKISTDGTLWPRTVHGVDAVCVAKNHPFIFGIARIWFWIK